MSTKVLLVQPYVPAYRVPFFEKLAMDCRRVGIDLSVAHGRPIGTQNLRGDAASVDCALPVPEYRVRLASHEVVFRSIAEPARRSDLVILSEGRLAIENYVQLFGVRRRPLAVMGHGYIAARESSTAGQRWMDALNLRSNWFFAYTDGGARHLEAKGFDRSTVTTFRNSTDTEAIRRAAASLEPVHLDHLRGEFGLTDGKTAVFVGGLDRSKRLDFLLESFEIAFARDRSLRLLIAGDGAQRQLVERRADAHSGIHYLGRRTGIDLASLLSVADFVAMPGRVGLAICDAAAMGLPVVTTRWNQHSVEIEYLAHGENGLVTDDSCDSYATTINMLASSSLLERLRHGANELGDSLGIEKMSARFTRGIVEALSLGTGR